MDIRVNTVQGTTETDLENINNLNHYIGMKPIDPAAIPELRFMPWIVGGLIVTGLAAAVIGRKKLLYGWLGLLVATGIVGLVDFWKWEYDYGHNLSPEAIIKIPGMTYQPPLIGAKQLLNFTAVSLPGAGAILAGVALLVACGAVVLTLRQNQSARIAAV
jgi:copper chaperone NosL